MTKKKPRLDAPDSEWMEYYCAEAERLARSIENKELREAILGPDRDGGE